VKLICPVLLALAFEACRRTYEEPEGPVLYVAVTMTVSSGASCWLEGLTFVHVTLAAGWHVNVQVSVDVPTFRTVKLDVRLLLKLPRSGPVPLAGVTDTACATFGQTVKLI